MEASPAHWVTNLWITAVPGQRRPTLFLAVHCPTAIDALAFQVREYGAVQPSRGCPCLGGPLALDRIGSTSVTERCARVSSRYRPEPHSGLGCAPSQSSVV